MNNYLGEIRHWRPSELRRFFCTEEHLRPGKLAAQYEKNPNQEDCAACSGTGIVRIGKIHTTDREPFIACLDCPFCGGYSI